MPARPVTVTLGEMTAHAERHLASGRFSSMSEVMRAGLRALDREEEALDALTRGRVAQALADPRPATPLADAFAAIRRGVAGGGDDVDGTGDRADDRA